MPAVGDEGKQRTQPSIATLPPGEIPTFKAMADTPHAPCWKAQRCSRRIRKQNTSWHIQSPNNVEVKVSAFEQKYFQEDPTAGDVTAVHNVSCKLS